MTSSTKQKVLKISFIIILLMVLLNIVCYTSLPASMIIRSGKSATLPKIILLVALPLMSYLVLKVAREDDHPKAGMFNILGQVVLFIANLLLLYINLA